MHSQNFQTIAAKYDAFVIDLWGVIHDGEALYPGALEALHHLHEQDKPVVFLSNAPRPAVHVIGTMERLGVPRRYYRDIVTSGGVAQATLALSEEQARWGRRCWYPGREIEADILGDSPFVPSAVEEADFVLMAGYDYFGQPLEEIRPRLEIALARGLPMLCINPDVEVIRLDGSRLHCAGQLAEWYRDAGGSVEFIGKPYPLVYEHALALFDGVDRRRILAIGDNVATDIPGGASAGLDTLLISGGILDNAGISDVRHYCAERDVDPTYILPGFRI